MYQQYVNVLRPHCLVTWTLFGLVVLQPEKAETPLQFHTGLRTVTKVQWLCAYLGKARAQTEDKGRPSSQLVLVGEREVILLGHSRRIYTAKLRHKYRSNVTFCVECEYVINVWCLR